MSREIRVWLIIQFMTCLCVFHSHAASTGFIQVNCEPEVNILLDGVLQGKTSVELNGLIISNVKAGSHSVMAVKNGFQSQEKRIIMQPDKIISLSFSVFRPKIIINQSGDSDESSLVAEVGSVIIQSIPIECKVECTALGISVIKKRMN